MIETQVNCIPAITKTLKLKPYQEFHIVDKELGVGKRNLYRFSEEHLQYRDYWGDWRNVENVYYLHDIIMGKSTITY